MFEGLFQPMHLLIILGLALLFFGPKRLPELGKGLGTSIRDFRDALGGGHKAESNPAQQATGQIAPPVAQPYVQAPPVAQAQPAAWAPPPAPPTVAQAEPPRPPANSTGA